MQLLEKHDFSEGSLGISCVLESIKNLLQGNSLPGSLLFNGLPYDSVRLQGTKTSSARNSKAKRRLTYSFANLLHNLILSKHVLINLLVGVVVAHDELSPAIIAGVSNP